jgi:hypothetical protein
MGRLGHAATRTAAVPWLSNGPQSCRGEIIGALSERGQKGDKRDITGRIDESCHKRAKRAIDLPLAAETERYGIPRFPA